MKTTRKIVAASVMAVALSFAAQAQWMTQRINLVAGWNAIHLKVNPADTSCKAVFSDDRITEVSWWNRDRLSDGTGSAIADFCNWYRDTPEASTFARVIGDQRYLVKSSGAVTLNVIGTPAIPRGTIYLGEFNLVGLNLNNLASDAPTYYEYFAPLTKITPVTPYYVTTANETQRISNKERASDASKAVWLDAKGSGLATYTGPFQLSLGSANAAQTLSWTDDPSLVRTLTVKNVSDEERVLNIELASSLPPPTGHGTLAGNVALLYETIDWSLGYARSVYEPFLNSGKTAFSTTLAAGETFELRLKPDTSSMSRTASGDYMGILVISDKGSTLALEARPDGTCLYRVGAFAKGTLMDNAQAAAAGLWVGTVVLGEVSRAKTLSSAEPEWGSENFFTAPHPFQFRLIVHVDAERNATILKEVFMAKATPESDTVLLTDRAAAIDFRGAYPNATIRRTASANFPFIEPLALTGGSFLEGGATLSATFTQEYDDKTNPFVHAFHPQHDNLAFNNSKPSKLESGDAGKGEYESWSVTREISLTFADEDPVGANVEWNRSVTGGIYTEKVSGLTGQGKPIFTRGVFRLTKVSD